MKRSGPLKRTALVRKAPMRRWRRKPEDRLDPKVRDHVLRRDRQCVIFTLVRLGRIPAEGNDCRLLDGTPIIAWTLDVLTYEHVHEFATMGQRAVNDPRWAVAACLHHNVNGGTSKFRPLIRDLLAEMAAKGKI